MNRCLTLGLLLVCLTCVPAQSPIRRKPQEKIPEVDSKCLNCICQASSKCDETLKCHNAGGAYFCGPYVISWGYWHDGGRPGDKGAAHDFETCLNNKTCAEEAIRGYMRNHAQDCDGNGAIDCYDFARLHKLGYGDCGGGAFLNKYWEIFEFCYAGFHNNNDGNYDGANDGSYGGANDGSYGGANDGSYGGGNDGGGNDGGANYNGGNLGDFVDYGDDHIQARNARMGG